MTGLLLAFNGPPQSGKDSIAKAFRERVDEWAVHPSHMIALANPLRHAACVLVGAREAITDDFEYERLKRTAVLGELTLRDVMIRLSEDVVKNYGDRSHWAETAWKAGIHSWLKMNSIVTITDLGFDEEQIFFADKCLIHGLNHCAFLRSPKYGKCSAFVLRDELVSKG